MAWPSAVERRSAFFQAVKILWIIVGWKDRGCAAEGGDCRIRRSFCRRDLVMFHQLEALVSCEHLAAGGAGGRHSCKRVARDA